MKTLEAASSQSEFIVKRFMDLMSILNHEPIDVWPLIAENIKYMADAPHRACWNFCIINELCREVGVQSHPDNKIISVMLPINQSAMRRIPTYLIHEGGQEQAQNEEKYQFYHSEIQQSEEILNNNNNHLIISKAEGACAWYGKLGH